MIKKRLLIFFGVLSIAFLVGWTSVHRDGHVVSGHTVTYDRLAVTSTRVPIPIECEGLNIKAADGNSTNFIYVGGANVTTTGNNYELGAGDSISLAGQTNDNYFAANSVYLVADSSSPIYAFYICFE
jgi:hypothetical protein